MHRANLSTTRPRETPPETTGSVSQAMMLASRVFTFAAWLGNPALCWAVADCAAALPTKPERG